MKRLLLLLMLGLFFFTGSNAQEVRSYKAGEKVQVQWFGQWYPGEIISIGKEKNAGKYYIRYIGYDASWNEYVGPERIQPHGANTSSDKGKVTSTSETAIKATNASPLGRYVCQSYNPQTNFLEAQGEFVLNSNGTYRDLWNKQNGQWKFDAKQNNFTFSGVLNNGGKAYFLPEKRAGMIVFDWGNGVKRECYRQLAK